MYPDHPPVFADTAAWYALVDRSDQEHGEAKRWYRENDSPLVSTDYVFDESLTLMQRKVGHSVAVRFGKQFRKSGRVRIVQVEKQDREQAWELFVRYRDEEFSFTDCTSFAVMNRLDLNVAFTFDRDFTVAGYDITPV